MEGPCYGVLDPSYDVSNGCYNLDGCLKSLCEIDSSFQEKINNDNSTLVPNAISNCVRERGIVKNSCCGSSPLSYKKFNSDDHYCEYDELVRRVATKTTTAARTTTETPTTTAAPTTTTTVADIPTVIVYFDQNFDQPAALSASYVGSEFENLLDSGFVCNPNHNGDGIYTSTDTGDALTFYNGLGFFFYGAGFINSGLSFENNASFNTGSLIPGTASYDIQCIPGNKAKMMFSGTYLENMTNRNLSSDQEIPQNLGADFGSSTSTTTRVQ